MTKAEMQITSTIGRDADHHISSGSVAPKQEWQPVPGSGAAQLIFRRGSHSIRKSGGVNNYQTFLSL
jgi:hypothetical protein